MEGEKFKGEGRGGGRRGVGMRFQGRGRRGKRVEGLIKEMGFFFQVGNAPDTPPPRHPAGETPPPRRHGHDRFWPVRLWPVRFWLK